MSKSNSAVILILALIGIGVWFWPGGKAGSFISGACCTMILLVTIGQRQANRAADRLDKKLRDQFINTQNSKDGD
ncbi:MAG TPA: hypothetical protein VEB42_03655 [Chitinophagaceae bacterium]|nr:hypothetical protein [Chitinophagaceae bacterium]